MVIQNGRRGHFAKKISNFFRFCLHFSPLSPLIPTFHHFFQLFPTYPHFSPLFTTFHHFSPLFQLFTTIFHFSTLFTTFHYFSLLFTTFHYFSLLFTTCAGMSCPNRTLNSVRILVPTFYRASSPLYLTLQLISEQYMV